MMRGDLLTVMLHGEHGKRAYVNGTQLRAP